jgi:UTP:GlnB (protein PII) uridylyltransferase
MNHPSVLPIMGVRHRATLHLAMLMHDVGKGGKVITVSSVNNCARTLPLRLQMAANKKTMLMFLVRHHLIMPDLAFRRDITDATMLVDFARLVGCSGTAANVVCAHGRRYQSSRSRMSGPTGKANCWPIFTTVRSRF